MLESKKKQVNFNLFTYIQSVSVECNIFFLLLTKVCLPVANVQKCVLMFN